MFTELGIWSPYDTGVLYLDFPRGNNHIARPKSHKYMFTERLAISLACSSFGIKLGKFHTVADSSSSTN